jgi:hypothetical protein
MPAHRQSALLLHGLSQADQRWILAQLPQDDARVLRGHLRELRQLGIPADPSLVPSAPAGGQDPDLDAGVVGRASAASLQLALADEPAWLPAQLLALRPWPWRAAFLDGLAPERRAAIASAAGAVAGALPPRAEASLLAAVARLLAARLAAPALPAGMQPTARERRTFKRWF